MDSSTTSFKVGDRVAWASQHRNSPVVEREGRVVAVIPAGVRPDRERFAEALKNSDYARRRSVISYILESDGVQYWPYAWKIRWAAGADTTSGRMAPAPAPKAVVVPTVRDAIRALEAIAGQHGDQIPYPQARALLNAQFPEIEGAPSAGRFPVGALIRAAARRQKPRAQTAS